MQLPDNGKTPAVISGATGKVFPFTTAGQQH
jgi:hypothetical protein